MHDYENGILVPVDDINSLEKEIEKLIIDENLRTNIEKKAKNKYGLTLEQKLNKISKRIELLNEIMDVLN